MSENSSHYVSRGAQKLLGALDAFSIEPLGKVCVDLGCSTGGFTELLLHRGAIKVYAIDTAYGELAWKLRQDSRVVVMERTNARRLVPFSEHIDIVVIDISLLRLEVILEDIQTWVPKGIPVIALFKSQYQVRNKTLLEKGVIRDRGLTEKVLEEFHSWISSDESWSLLDAIPSPIKGKGGNQEFLFHLTFSSDSRVVIEKNRLISIAKEEI